MCHGIPKANLEAGSNGRQVERNLLVEQSDEKGFKGNEVLKEIFAPCRSYYSLTLLFSSNAVS